MFIGIFESSACRKNHRVVLSVGRLLTCNKKRVCPKIEPCGTPILAYISNTWCPADMEIETEEIYKYKSTDNLHHTDNPYGAYWSCGQDVVFWLQP